MISAPLAYCFHSLLHGESLEVATSPRLLLLHVTLITTAITPTRDSCYCIIVVTVMLSLIQT